MYTLAAVLRASGIAGCSAPFQNAFAGFPDGAGIDGVEAQLQSSQPLHQQRHVVRCWHVP
jgi:hypothetical protein